MTYNSATDPAVWGEFFGKLGPGGFALLVMLMGVVAIALIVVGFLLFWRGSERLGIVGFGKEYQLNRIAQEKQADALVRTEAAQEDIKALLMKIAPFAEVLVQWLHASMRQTPSPPPASPTNGARASSPNVQCAP